MAMILYSEEDFKAELYKLGLRETEHKTSKSQIWLYNGDEITIPYGRGNYPDYILDEIHCQIKKLETKASHLHEMSYEVQDDKIAKLHRP